MNKIWITDDFMCKISKYTPNVHTAHTHMYRHISGLLYHWMFAHSFTHREGRRRDLHTCRLEWKIRWLSLQCVCVHKHIPFLLCGVKMMWVLQRGFMEILLTLIPNAQHQIHQCLCYRVKKRSRESEICTCNAYYSIAASFIRRRFADMFKCAVWQIITMHFQQANKQTNKQILQIKRNKDV